MNAIRTSLIGFVCFITMLAAPAQAKAMGDVTYPGTITLSVDLTDAPRRIFRVKETIPVKPGPLSLSYPKWIPGEHGPTGPIEGLTGLKFSGKGQAIAWRRDLEDMFTVNLVVPAGVTELNAEFQFLSPGPGGNFSAGVSATPKLVALNWNQVVLYPAGYQGDRVMLTPSVKLPAGWSFATALQKTAESKDGTQFAPVTLTDLIDSPLSAGQHYRRVDLAPGATPSVHLNLFADREENLAMTDLQIKHHRELVKQAVKFFGAQHYDRYNFLLILSDRTAHFGLEHHESSDNRSSADFFTSPTAYLAHPTLLPHEYTHSWNGKFRRPAALATGNFFSPMKGELLWVYEGMTNYMGEVFAARSGMWTPEQYRDALAITAAQMDMTPGRGWRPLQDTADQAQVLYNAPSAWANYRRLVDFYPEGSLVWLDVDTKIRELTGNKRSLDDYAQIFYGKDPAFSKTSHDVKPYTFEDVVKALNTTVAFDWATFLKTRLTSTNERAPLDGITRGGWKLVYTATPTDVYKAIQKENKTLDLFPSLGFIVSAAPGHGSEPGMVNDVLWNSPAFEAGLVPGMKIVAIDGVAFDADLLEAAVQRTAKAKQTIELLVQSQDYFSTIRISYAGGPKYPRLERIADKPDLLTPVVTTK